MSSIRLSRWARALAQPVTYLGVTMIAIVWAALFYMIHEEYEGAYRQAQRQGSNLARVFEEHVSRSVKSVDNTLLYLRKIYHSDPAKFDLAAWVNDPELRNDMTSQFSIISADGFVITSSFGPLETPIDVRGREHYLQHLISPTDELFITKPLVMQTSGKNLILLTRRLTAPDGSFAGIITAAIDPYKLEKFYSSVDLGKDGIVSLVGFDGIIRSRGGSGGKSHGEYFGRVIINAPVFKIYRQSPAGSYWNVPGAVDDVKRLVSYRVVEGFPLIAIVGLSEKDIYAGPAHERIIYYGIGLVITLAIMLAMGIGVLREMKLSSATRRLERTNTWFHAALNHMSQGLAMFDAGQRLIVCNDKYRNMYGLSSEQVKQGTALSEIVQHRIAKGIYAGTSAEDYLHERLSPVSKMSVNMHELSDGRSILVSRQPMSSGGWVTTHQDITERQQAVKQIAYMAHHDALTGLANRVLFQEQIGLALARLRKRGEPFTLLLLDLDRFKTVNDSLGHAFGDKLIKEVATRLCTAVGETEVVARLGGDEFAILQGVEGNQKKEAEKLADRLLDIVSKPYELDGRQVILGTSIGIALAPEHGVDADQLLKNADLALYRAKAEGRNAYRFFATEMDLEVRARHALEFDLRNALLRNEFELHYQPVVRAATQEICGMEALVRWRHPQNGMVAPNSFIPLAEETGLIIPLGEWILRKACADAAGWPFPVKVAVNLSAVQFRKGNLLDIVSGALAESGLPAERLEIEITESVLLQKDEASLATLHQLRKLGASIVLDDFGTGYSSFSYLQMFPFNKIKIDKSFIDEISSRPDSAAIVCAVTSLARSLNMETTAEGVETLEQFNLLRAAGCSQAQGYLFGRPKPLAELDFGQTERVQNFKPALSA